MWEKRLSRRQALVRGAAAGSSLALASALACSRSGGRQSNTSAGASSGGAKQPRRGGTIVYAGGNAGSLDTRGLGFDPHTQLPWFTKTYTLVYERLIAYNLRTYAIEPEIGQKWEQPSQTEYLFSLQPGVKFHNKPPANGRALTAEDVVWSLERARSGDPRILTKSLLSAVDKIEAPDAKTIRLTTKGPDASTYKKLAAENLDILAREVMEKYPKPHAAEEVIGTGAFMMTSVEDNVGAQYQRNPDYWKPGRPYLDGFRTRDFPDYLAAWASFQADAVDIAIVPATEVKNYLAKQGSGYTPDWFADDTTYSILSPNTQVAPMTDPRVPRALRLLVDHNEWITSWAETLYGRGAYGSIFPTALHDWDLTQDEYKQQLEWKQPKDDAVKEALNLLAAGGFTKEKPLKFTLTGGNSGTQTLALQLLQSQWKRLGQGVVDVDIRTLDSNASNAARSSKNFTYFFTGYSAGPVDPDSWLAATYHTGGSGNTMNWSDPQADAMIDKQRTIFDETQRKAAVKEIVRYMIDHCPSTFGAVLYWLQAAKPKVQDFVGMNTLQGRQFQWVWLSK